MRAIWGRSVSVRVFLANADSQVWEQFGLLARARLSQRERVVLAWAALRSLDPEDATAVAEDVIGGAGYPLAPFLSPIEDAAHWADMANAEELSAYLIASFRKLSRGDCEEFIEYAIRRRAA